MPRLTRLAVIHCAKRVLVAIRTTDRSPAQRCLSNGRFLDASVPTTPPDCGSDDETMRPARGLVGTVLEGLTERIQSLAVRPIGVLDPPRDVQDRPGWRQHNTAVGRPTAYPSVGGPTEPCRGTVSTPIVSAGRIACRSPPYPKLPLSIASTMLIAAGPRITTNRAGKMKRTSGKTSFTGALNARSCARWRRRIRISSA